MSRKKALSATKGKGVKTELSKSSDKSLDEYSDQDWLQAASSGSLAWRSKLISTPKLAKQLLNCDDPAELVQQVAKILQLDDLETSVINSSIVDCIALALRHAADKEYTILETSAFVSLQFDLLCNIKDHQFTLEQQMEFLASTMMSRSSIEPWQPDSPMLDFHGSTTIDVARYCTETLLLHHNLYHALFAHTPDPIIHPAAYALTLPQEPSRLQTATPLLKLVELRREKAEQDRLEGVVPAGLTPKQANIVLQHVIDNYLTHAQDELEQEVDEHVRRRFEGSTRDTPS